MLSAYIAPLPQAVYCSCSGAVRYRQASCSLGRSASRRSPSRRSRTLACSSTAIRCLSSCFDVCLVHFAWSYITVSLFVRTVRKNSLHAVSFQAEFVNFATAEVHICDHQTADQGCICLVAGQSPWALWVSQPGQLSLPSVRGQ